MIYYHASREADFAAYAASARCVEALLFEFVGDLLSDFLRTTLVHQRDDGATEAAAGHAGAVCAVLAGHVHGHAELGHSDLVVRGQRIMGGVEQAARGSMSPLAKARTKERTRSISVTTWRTRFFIVSSGSASASP